MNYINLIILFFLGASFGSFVNLMRYRIPKKESIILPKSYCDNCREPLSYLQKIPIISSIFLHNRCRFCGYKPSLEYGLLELFSGLLFILNLYSENFLLTQSVFTNYIFKCFFITMLLLISLIDIDTLNIPNKLNLYFYVLGLLVILFSSFDFYLNFEILISRVFFSFLIFFCIEVFSFLYFLIRKKIPIGTGDAKLISVLSIWLGPVGCITSLVSSIYFAATYILYSFIRKFDLKSEFAFAPFISLGALLYLTVGQRLTSIIFLN